MALSTSRTAAPVLWLGILILFSPVFSQEAFTFDLKVKFYSDASLICDHPRLNISEKISEIRGLSWTFPDGAAVDASTVLNPRMFELSSGPGGLAGYNLTVLQVSDEVFGYYTCIVVYNDVNKGISVIRWGLNVDGADFSDLLATFEENAIIGGIAAAAMLVVVGSTCLIWHFRFSNRQRNAQKGLDDDMTRVDDVTKQMSHVVYSNKSYVVDGDMSEIDLHSDNSRNDRGMKM